MSHNHQLTFIRLISSQRMKYECPPYNFKAMNYLAVGIRFKTRSRFLIGFFAVFVGLFQ